MSYRFSTPFDRETHRSAFASALLRRGVVGVHVWLERHGGLGADTRGIKGRDKAASTARSRSFRAFLGIDRELLCERHQPSEDRQCDACLCWFRGDSHTCEVTCSADDATVTGFCPFATWREELDEAGTRTKLVYGDQGTMPHRWPPARCEACHQVHSADLDDLRALLRATLPSERSSGAVA